MILQIDPELFKELMLKNYSNSVGFKKCTPCGRPCQAGPGGTICGHTLKHLKNLEVGNESAKYIDDSWRVIRQGGAVALRRQSAEELQDLLDQGIEIEIAQVQIGKKYD